jgi:hypothetical protein
MENNQVTNIQITRSLFEDTVNDIFKICVKEEILELGNEFCKYYYATEDNNKNTFFAIVFENDFIPRVEIFESLLQNPIPGLNNILAYSIVYLSHIREERLVVIVDGYDIDSTLKALLKRGKTLDYQELERAINSVNDVLIHLKDRRIFCCNINPSNILMKDDKFYALREFINTYPNFHQEEQYLAPELIECDKGARFIENSLSDIYSLGVSMFEVYTNKAYWNDYATIKDYNHARFEKSTSKCLFGKLRMPEKLRKFFKHTMQDDASIRWQSSDIQEWVNGKNRKSIIEPINESKNLIEFEGHNYSTFKSLAYGLYNNWTEGVKILKDIRLLKWVGRHQVSSDVLEEIQSLSEKKSDFPFVIVNNVTLSKKLSKLLSIIDYNGCIRYEGVGLSPSSIPYFIHFLLTRNNKSVIEKVFKLIKEQSWRLYEKQQSSVGYLDKDRANNFLEQVKEIAPESIIGSFERITYSLNSSLVCQSKLLKGKYITSISELLVGLNSNLEKKNINFTIDKHIMAFIAAKLELKEDIKFVLLSNFPKISQHPVMRNLTIIHLLHEKNPDIEISNICSALALDIQKLLEEHLYNVEFKNQVIKQIQEALKEGNIEIVMQILSNQKQFIDDYNGYYSARKQANIMEQNIRLLSDENNLFNSTLLLGQKTTVLLSYVLCFVVTMVSIM